MVITNESGYLEKFCPDRMRFFLSFYPKKYTVMVSIIHFLRCFDKSIPTSKFLSEQNLSKKLFQQLIMSICILSRAIWHAGQKPTFWGYFCQKVYNNETYPTIFGGTFDKLPQKMCLYLDILCPNIFIHAF